MNFIIFGSSGFIGTHLVDYIANNDTYSNIFRYDIQKKISIDFEILDVRFPVNINIYDSPASIIYNLAAVHITPGHTDNEYFETNVSGAENICNFARQNNINTIVFTSSIAPYGPSEDLKEETTLPMPNSPYGISKLSAEYIHKLWQCEDPANRKLIIVRPGVVFGKYEGGNFTRLYKSLKKGMFFYPGRKDTLKAAVYIKDVVRILYETSVNVEPGVTIYNLTYDPAPSIESICEAIAEITGIKRPKLLIPGNLLKFAAGGVYALGSLIGKNVNGIHPVRVKKLIVSTNISGSKLSQSDFKLHYTLKEAIADWYSDCEQKGLF